MEYKTTVARDIRGNWGAKTEVLLDFQIEGKPALLQVYTIKVSSGSLNTVAKVDAIDGKFSTHRMYTDFCKTMKSSRPSRITEKLVTVQQLSIVELVPSILEMVNEYYAKTVS
jgi:hypothetical protein